MADPTPVSTGTTDPARAPQGRRKFGSVVWRGKFWSIRWRSGGREHMEATHSANRRVAEALLARREAELSIGSFVPRQTRGVRFEKLAELLRMDYRLRELRSADRVEIALAHLAEEFAGTPALNLTPERLLGYQLRRVEEGAAAASIRYEFACLRRGFRLAVDLGLLPRAPRMPKVTVNNIREGFLEDAELERLCRELPDHLIPVARFAAWTGWRRGEIVGLTWDRVSFQEGTIRLDPGTTKTRAGRMFPFGALPELAALLAERRAITDADQQEYHTVIRFVFTRRGRQLRDFYHAWRSACDRAGLSGSLLHDLRRTAARNLIRCGVSEPVAMRLLGHATRSIFDRYNVTSTNDLAEGVRKLADRTGAKGALRGRPLPRAAGDSA